MKVIRANVGTHAREVWDFLDFLARARPDFVAPRTHLSLDGRRPKCGKELHSTYVVAPATPTTRVACRDCSPAPVAAAATADYADDVTTSRSARSVAQLLSTTPAAEHVAARDRAGLSRARRLAAAAAAGAALAIAAVSAPFGASAAADTPASWTTPHPLPAAQLAELLNRCAAHVHPQTQAALVATESSGDPLAIHDNNTNRAYFPPSYDDAVQLASQLVADDLRRHGRGIDVGLGQIDDVNFAAQHVDVADLLRPCANLTVSARMLHAAYRAYHRNLDRALQSYNPGDPGYVGRIRSLAASSYVRSIVPAAIAPSRIVLRQTAFAAPRPRTAQFYTESPRSPTEEPSH